MAPLLWLVACHSAPSVPVEGACGRLDDADIYDLASVEIAGDPNHPILPLAVGDADGVAGDDIVVGSYADDALYLFAGPMAPELDPSQATARVLGSEEVWNIGTVAALPGDVTGDGVADLWVRAAVFGADTDHGQLWLFAGPLAADLGEPVAVIEEAHSSFPSGLLSHGDLTGDGSADLVATVWGAPEAWVLGSSQTESGEVAALAAAHLLAPDGAYGTVADTADVDGDGVDDLLVGTPAVQGSAWLVLGPLSGDVDLAAAAVTSVSATTASVQLGDQVTIDTDSDGDGHPDLWVSDPFTEDRRGVVARFSGDRRGPLTPDDADARVAGVEAEGCLDIVRGVGDLDADGAADVVVGTVCPALRNSYLLYGRIEGSLDLADAVAIGGGQPAVEAAPAHVDEDDCADLWFSSASSTLLVGGSPR